MERVGAGKLIIFVWISYQKITSIESQVISHAFIAAAWNINSLGLYDYYKLGL